MDAKQAIEIAKEYVTDLFGEDGLGALRLEEIERRNGAWSVTVGFARPMALSEMPGGATANLRLYGPRIYRVVTIDDGDGTVTAVRIRDGLD